MENAPGPINAIPKATMATRIPIMGAPKDPSGGAGIQESAMLKTHRPNKMLAITVTKPTMSAIPLAAKTAPTSHTASVGAGLVRQEMPRTIATAPTASRSNSSPRPGLPSGKLENRRCSGSLPTGVQTHALKVLGCERARKPLIAEFFTNPFVVWVLAEAGITMFPDIYAVVNLRTCCISAILFHQR